MRPWVVAAAFVIGKRKAKKSAPTIQMQDFDGGAVLLEPSGL